MFTIREGLKKEEFDKIIQSLSVWNNSPMFIDILNILWQLYEENRTLKKENFILKKWITL